MKILYNMIKCEYYIFLGICILNKKYINDIGEEYENKQKKNAINTYNIIAGSNIVFNDRFFKKLLFNKK